MHWDLMLQVADVLETYRLELPPERLQGQSGGSVTAVKIFDHPLKFLIYEGSVNKGKDSVQTADAGTYQLLNESEGYKELQLNGKVLKGKFTLIHTEGNKWELRF